MRILIFLLFLLPLSLIGQVESQFNGTLNVFSASRIGFTNTFTISGIFTSTTTSYTSANSAVGDIVQVQSGSRFYWMHIYSIASNSGGVITCNVRDSSSTLTTFPTGKWSIFRPTPNLRLPLSPDGETNASRSATFNTLALRVDEIQTSVASATNCEITLTKNSHGFSKWTPLYWTGSTFVRPTYDTLVPDYIVVDSLTANTFVVATCGTYPTTLADGIYWYTNQSPGYSLTQDTTKAPLFQVIDSTLILNPIVGFNLMSSSGSGDVTSSVLADTAAAIRADFPSGGVTDGDKGEITVTSSGAIWTIDNGVVTSAKIASQTVDSLDVKNRSITTVKIEDNAITTGKILNGTITTSDLAFQVPSITRVPNYNQNATYDSRFMIYASAIVRPSNTYVLNNPITWEFLTFSTSHDYIFFSSAQGLSSSQRLSIRYPKVKRVLNVHVTPDETLAGMGISCGSTVGLDSLEIQAARFVVKGVKIQGNGSGGWTQSPSGLLDITSYSTGSSFNYTSAGYDAVYDYNATSITYVGSNNYRIRRVFSGLGSYNMRFILVDNTTNADIATNPTTSDHVVISGGGISPSPVALATWGASNSLISSSANFWVSGWFEAWMVASPISTSSIIVRWQPSYPSATNYKIYRDTNSNFSTQVLVHTGTSGEYTDTGLSSNTLYYYKLVGTVGSDITITTFATRTEQ